MRRTIRVGVTGLAQAGKTTLLTSLAANLLAAGAGLPALPGLTQRLAGRSLRVAVAPSGADSTPRFDYAAKLAALDADPPGWPARTQGANLLSLDLEIGRAGFASTLPPQRIRLELLDYPGEWLLDLPLAAQTFAQWSEQTLHRLDSGPGKAYSAEFRGFVAGLPASAPADETLARTGHELYRTLLRRLRDEGGLAMLQPGRLLMPAPGDPPPWIAFFPLPGGSPLAGLLRTRYDRYVKQVRDDLVSPFFGQIDRVVVLADVLGALSQGPHAFADMRAALAAASGALRWRAEGGVASLLPAWLGALTRLAGGVRRLAFAATKADHVADRQRGNLAGLMRSLVETPATGATLTHAMALAAVRCTTDLVWTLEGRPVSAVRGRVLGDDRPARSYPGEVPDRPPDAAFWVHPFLDLPVFEPMRPVLGGRGGVPHINLDALIVFLLGDILP